MIKSHWSIEHPRHNCIALVVRRFCYKFLYLCIFSFLLRYSISITNFLQIVLTAFYIAMIFFFLTFLVNLRCLDGKNDIGFQS